MYIHCERKAGGCINNTCHQHSPLLLETAANAAIALATGLMSYSLFPVLLTKPGPGLPVNMPQHT